MNRMLASLRLDFRLQWRYGFYYAAAFVTLVWIVLLFSLPASLQDLVIPLIIFTDLGVVGFYFMAGQIIFEKTERTIYALVVTPLNFQEYLGAKLVSLTLLSCVVSLVVAVAARGLQFNILLFLLGVILMSLLALLVGLIGVAPYNSISTFIMPSQLYFLLLNIPLIHYFGWIESPLLYIIPTQGALLLLKGAYTEVQSWQVIYAVVYQIVWIFVLTRLARLRFEQYIVAHKGGR